MDKYAEIDRMILDSIGDNPKQFWEIYDGELYKACVIMTGPNREPARVLDRRLQALRKKGLIVFMKGWRKVPPAE